MTAHLDFLSQKQFGSLDGLRAVSILAVIWHHTAPAWVGRTLSTIGSEGVSLFFAISGFLITTLLLRERDRNGTIELKAFYLRRTLRIFPLYYGVLMIYIVLVALVEKQSAYGQAFFSNLPYFATYTSNMFVHRDGRVIFYFAWSLATEEQFYVLWPSVLYLTGSVSRALIPLSIAILVCIAGQLAGNRFLSAVPIAIIAGALLAVVLHTERGFHFVQMFLGRTWSSAIIIASLALALTVMAAPGFVIHLLFVALVGSCVVRENHMFAPVLTLKTVAYIGSISYGMYMLHMLCKNAVVKLLGGFGFSINGLGVFASTLLVAILAASLSFRYYESFFMRLKRRYER